MPLQDDRQPQVLIAAPYGRDAESLAAVVSERGHAIRICASLGEVAERLDESVGAVVLTEEAFLGGEAQRLGDVLRAQETWSDVPFVLLRAARSKLRTRPQAISLEIGNLIELERPVGAASLLSAVVIALRAREKQFVIRDQMERLAESQSSLASSEAELRLVADSLPVLIAFVDAGLIYRFANRAYETWLGIPLSAIVGRPMEEVLRSREWVVRRPYVQQALAGASVHFEATWPTAGGGRRDCEIRYLPRRDAQGRVDGFHVFVADVTDKRLAMESVLEQAGLLEAKVAERTAELEAQMAAREATESALRQAQKMEAVGQLTGGIAHDFNNMLTGIMSALDLIRLRVEQGRVDGLARWIDVASASTQRAASLTQRLLAFSRRQLLDARSVALNELVESLQDLMRSTLGEAVRLSIDLEEGLPTVRVDANQFESALLNLAINARDAMPHGGDLCIRSHSVRVDTPEAGPEGIRAGRYAVISVSDTGEGIPPDVLDRIFEPFFTTKPLGQGTGLGMSMIYGFMQQSEGYVRIASTVGQGTTVSLYLPEAAADEENATAAELPPPRSGRGQRILVVEDDEQVRLLVTELLSELGYEAEVVASADAAIPRLAAAAPLDLLVTDVGLPGLNGRQLAEVARQLRPVLPILFMTGYAETARNQSDFLAEGMSMIAKPFSLSELGEAVARIFGTGGALPRG
ncbi:PAS domain-containing protein [Xanthomonas sp. Kuri4-1]